MISEITPGKPIYFLAIYRGSVTPFITIGHLVDHLYVIGGFGVASAYVYSFCDDADLTFLTSQQFGLVDCSETLAFVPNSVKVSLHWND